MQLETHKDSRDTTSPSPYDSTLYLYDFKTEMDRLHNLSQLMWPKERRNLEDFGLRDGMSVMELGSGPGFFTERLSTLIPNGSITCVEPEPAFIKLAQDYLKDRARCDYQIVEATVETMNLPENTFDFVIARLVFQHLKEHVGIAKKLMRYLKPGGRLVITDFDADLPPVTEPPITEARAALVKAMRVQAMRGTNISMGRSLWNILKHAGYQDLDLDAVLFHSGVEGPRSCYPQFAPSRLKPLVTMGLISEEEMRSLEQAVDQYVASEDSFFLRVVLMACGRKPDA